MVRGLVDHSKANAKGDAGSGWQAGCRDGARCQFLEVRVDRPVPTFWPERECQRFYTGFFALILQQWLKRSPSMLTFSS